MVTHLLVQFCNLKLVVVENLKHCLQLLLDLLSIGLCGHKLRPPLAKD